MGPFDTAGYLALWQLDPEGEAFETPTSWLQPVASRHGPAMLKALKPESDEGNAPALLRYWDGDGAVRVYRSDQHAVLLERAKGKRSLGEMAINGGDLEAAEILAQGLAKLHQSRPQQKPAGLKPLADQFSSLFDLSAEHPNLGRCAEVARALLDDPREIMPLHGNLHHWNLLDGGERGWLAIDPKALIGERTYDVANLLRNPWPYGGIVHDIARMRRLAEFYAERLDLDVQRVLKFAFAHSGLSAAWDLEDGDDPSFSLTCTEILKPLLEPAA